VRWELLAATPAPPGGRQPERSEGPERSLGPGVPVPYAQICVHFFRLYATLSNIDADPELG